MAIKDTLKDITEGFAAHMARTMQIIVNQEDEAAKKEELIISLELWAHEATCYAENLKEGREYDDDVEFMA